MAALHVLRKILYADDHVRNNVFLSALPVLYEILCTVLGQSDWLFCNFLRSSYDTSTYFGLLSTGFSAGDGVCMGASI